MNTLTFQDNPCLGATLGFWDSPLSVYGMCISLDTPTSYLSLCLSLNSFCDGTSRTWASLSPETSCVISVKRPRVQVPAWVLAGFQSRCKSSSPNLSDMVSVWLLCQSNRPGQPIPLNAPWLCIFLLPDDHSPVLHFCSLDSHFPNKVLTCICFERNSKSNDLRECNFLRGVRDHSLIQNQRWLKIKSSLEIVYSQWCGQWLCDGSLKSATEECLHHRNWQTWQTRAFPREPGVRHLPAQLTCSSNHWTAAAWSSASGTIPRLLRVSADHL